MDSIPVIDLENSLNASFLISHPAGVDPLQASVSLEESRKKIAYANSRAKRQSLSEYIVSVQPTEE